MNFLGLPGILGASLNLLQSTMPKYQDRYLKICNYEEM
jgi:hypothetical protein